MTWWGIKLVVMICALRKSTWSFFEAISMPTSCNLLVKLSPIARFRWRQHVHASMGLEFVFFGSSTCQLYRNDGIHRHQPPDVPPMVAGSPVTYHNLLVPSVTLSWLPPNKENNKKINRTKLLVGVGFMWGVNQLIYLWTVLPLHQSSTTIWWCRTSHTELHPFGLTNSKILSLRINLLL